VATPRAGPGEALVRVAAVGVNPADWKASAGLLPFLSARTLPLIPGFDGAGTVVALGEGVATLASGDRVAFMSGLPMGRGGTWSDYALCPAEHAVRLPDSLCLAAAATIPVAGISAREALQQGGLAAGQRVLINGGAGGTGSWAIQIARAAGADVAATARADNHDLLGEMGAGCAIDYTRDGVAARIAKWAPQGVDLLLDTVGQGSLSDPAALINNGGRYVAIETMLPDEALPDPQRFAARDIVAIRASAGFHRLHEHLAALVEAVARREISVPPFETMPLEEAADALERVRGAHVRGKLVLLVGQDDERAVPPATAVKDYA